MTNYSKNEKAERLLGKRGPGTPIDQPAELGYRCPVCRKEPYAHGHFNESLHWSEYNGFLWCSVCNVDYPSCLCKSDPVKATEVFLAVVEEAMRRADLKQSSFIKSVASESCQADTEKG